MKEKDLIKSATDRQMPDLEQIRQNVLNQTERKKEKPKILNLRPSRLIVVAAVAALVVIGSIAAVANQNGGLFAPQAEETTAPTSTQPQSTVKKVKKTSSKPIQSNTSSAPVKAVKQSNTERYINRLTKKGYNVKWLYDIGKAEGYHIFYAGSDNYSEYDCDYILGDYTFEADNQQSPYGLGLYVSNEKHSYTLTEAYKKGIFDNFSKVASLIEKYDRHNIGIEVMEKLDTSEEFRNYLGGRNIITLAKLKENSKYKLYYHISFDDEEADSQKDIGGYTFYLNAEQEPYSLGLYVVHSGIIDTLEAALDSEILNMDAVYEAVHADSSVPYNFSLFKNTEDETEPQTTEVENETIDEDY